MNIDNYTKTGWIKFFKVFSWLGLIIFFGLGIYADEELRNEELFIVFVVLGFLSLIQGLLIAWCIELFSDMRHYLRLIVIRKYEDKYESVENDSLKKWNEH